MTLIKDVTADDAEELLKIYEYYVMNTAVSFEITTPSADEFKDRIVNISASYPYIVLVSDGRIEGYAYAHAFVGREAYSHSCEMTIYLRNGSQGRGFGRALYEALESRLKKKGIINLYACIGIPERDDEYLTSNSADFHEHMGYRTVGIFHNCGRKFGRWYSMIWMEKIIGSYD